MYLVGVYIRSVATIIRITCPLRWKWALSVHRIFHSYELLTAILTRNCFANIFRVSGRAIEFLTCLNLLWIEVQNFTHTIMSAYGIGHIKGMRNSRYTNRAVRQFNACLQDRCRDIYNVCSDEHPFPVPPQNG